MKSFIVVAMALSLVSAFPLPHTSEISASSNVLVSRGSWLPEGQSQPVKISTLPTGENHGEELEHEITVTGEDHDVEPGQEIISTDPTPETNIATDTIEEIQKVFSAKDREILSEEDLKLLLTIAKAPHTVDIQSAYSLFKSMKKLVDSGEKPGWTMPNKEVFEGYINNIADPNKSGSVKPEFRNVLLASRRLKIEIDLDAKTISLKYLDDSEYNKLDLPGLAEKKHFPDSWFDKTKFSE